MKNFRGYTLIELIVSIGLFALVMTLAAGAYLVIIGVNRTAEATATGINSLSFALEDMTRTVRTGTAYSCGGPPSCTESSFSLTAADGTPTTYALSAGAITKNGVVLTDPTVTVGALTFYVSGVLAGDTQQPHVTMLISGTVTSGPGKTIPFSVETGATMRGPDL